MQELGRVDTKILPKRCVLGLVLTRPNYGNL